MGLTSLQGYMDTSQWFQVDEMGIIDSSSPSEEIIPCSRPLPERRLRPQHDQALKCPRCDSTHTKFCYYNNYSLSQPRYFCKTCRRYWTQGGTLRNVPVGGGCKKNKRVGMPIRRTSVTPPNQHSTNPMTDLNLSFSGAQRSHLNNLMGVPRNNDQREGKLDSILGSLRNHDFNVPAGELGHVGHHGSTYYGFNSLSSPFGFSMDGNQGTFMDTCEKLVLDPDHTTEMKPSNKILAVEWQDQGSDFEKDAFGYLNVLGSWSGMINGYGSSATNPMI